MVQLDYNSMGINSTTLNNIGFPGGNVRIFSATLDPIVHLNPRGPFDVYLIGGGGLFIAFRAFGPSESRSRDFRATILVAAVLLFVLISCVVLLRLSLVR